MKTILIAEDEKFIRKGLITMVRRSSIPVETILEARDGEEALAVLEQNPVDLLITDIRMPKMDGIELVSRLGDQDHQPMVLVISGYDDFSYAVEMLRQGAFDYLLKPVERDRLYSVLEKLEEQYQRRQAAQADRDQQLFHALRHLMLEQDPQSEEWLRQVEQYRDEFFHGPYVGFCAGDRAGPFPEGVLRLHGVGKAVLYAAAEEKADQLSALLPPPVGRSGIQKGLDTLHICYKEAYAAWQRSFFSMMPCISPEPVRFQPLRTTAQKLAGMIGLSQGREAVRLLDEEAIRAAGGETDPNAFAELCREFTGQLRESYQDLLAAGSGPERFASLWEFENWEQYLAEFSPWLEELCGRTVQEFADYENKQKIRQAVQYIQQHFQEPLSMTVVSNHVSMNYSLFSLLFKQYTGSNFVSYLQSLRLEEAKRLLEQTDWRVNEICRRAGFSDEKHFLKVFKAAVGFSPTEYRKSKLLLSPEKEPQ